MAKCLAIHPAGSGLTMEAGAPVGKSAKAHLTADAYWMGSIYVPETAALYGTWDAKDADAIRKVRAKVAPELSAEGP